MLRPELLKSCSGINRVIRLCLLMALAFVAINISGCWLTDWITKPFVPPQIVKHPDSPMLIQEAKSNYLRVAIYDKENNQLIEYGWIEITNDNLKGWTISKYDWESFIERKRIERGDN